MINVFLNFTWLKHSTNIHIDLKNHNLINWFDRGIWQFRKSLHLRDTINTSKQRIKSRFCFIIVQHYSSRLTCPVKENPVKYLWTFIVGLRYIRHGCSRDVKTQTKRRFCSFRDLETLQEPERFGGYWGHVQSVFG